MPAYTVCIGGGHAGLDRFRRTLPRSTWGGAETSLEFLAAMEWQCGGRLEARCVVEAAYLRLAMPRPGLLFTLRLTPVIGAMLARRGIAIEPLLAKAKLPLEALAGEVTAPLARVQALMALAAQALGSDLFGIELAGAMPAGLYGIAEFLVRSAPTAGDSLALLCEFSPLINPITNMRMLVTDTEGAFHYAVGSERDILGVHLNECWISYLVRQF
jgi:hypothetical protein